MEQSQSAAHQTFLQPDVLGLALTFLHIRERMLICPPVSHSWNAAFTRSFCFSKDTHYDLSWLPPSKAAARHRQPPSPPSVNLMRRIGTLLSLGSPRGLTVMEAVKDEHLRALFLLESPPALAPSARQLVGALRTISLYGCEHITDKFMATELLPLLGHAPLLHSLNLNGCFGITNRSSSLQQLPKMLPALTSLDLYAGGINDEVLSGLAGELQHLKHMELGYCEVLSDLGVRRLLSSDNASQLVSLGLHKTVNGEIERDTLLLLSRCHRLTKLDMSTQYQVDREVLSELPDTLENLTLHYYSDQLSRFTPQDLVFLSERLTVLHTLELSGTSWPAKGSMSGGKSVPKGLKALCAIMETPGWKKQGWTCERRPWSTRWTRIPSPSK